MAYSIKKPNPYSIIIYENKFTNALNFVYTIGFFIVWYGGILSVGSMDKDAGLIDRVKNLFSMSFSELWQTIQFIVSDRPFLLIFILAPVLAVPSLYRNIRVALAGNKLHFDVQSHAVYHNKEQVADFSEFERLEMSSESSEGLTEYNLQAIKRGEEDSFFIISKRSREKVYQLGQDISELTGIKMEEIKEEG